MIYPSLLGYDDRAEAISVISTLAITHGEEYVRGSWGLLAGPSLAVWTLQQLYEGALDVPQWSFWAKNLLMDPCSTF